MKFFWVLSGKKLKQYTILSLSAVFAVGLFIAEKENIQLLSAFSPSGPSAIYSVKTDKKQIALTFDISWGEERTGPILDILEQKGVKKATFFLSGPWVGTHKEYVERIVKMGFEVASHGNRHDNYSEYNDAKIKEQITLAHDAITKAAGKPPTLIRMPNGDFDKRVLKIATDMNYKVIQWDTDSMDWMNPGVDKIVNKVVSKAHPGDIVLMHASDSCKQTHEALPQIIDKLRGQGYDLVSVSELISGSDVKMKPVE